MLSNTQTDVVIDLLGWYLGLAVPGRRQAVIGPTTYPPATRVALPFST